MHYPFNNDYIASHIPISRRYYRHPMANQRIWYSRSVSLLMLACFLLLNISGIAAQPPMQNIGGRHRTSLNGKWQVLINPFDRRGEGIASEAQPAGKTDFAEYGFTNSYTLDVPGDWNSQLPELKYYEGTIWYKKTFTCYPATSHRVFLYFGAVNYECDVYLNGQQLGHHEGGFLPFQFDATAAVKWGDNNLLVRANNERRTDGIPARNFDWWNYGGITRDVDLVETPDLFVQDYFLQLQKGSINKVQGWVKLNTSAARQSVTITLPEAGIRQTVTTDEQGYAPISFGAKLTLWSPENPKLYTTLLMLNGDTIEDRIGFRTIQVSGTNILLNGKSVFLKGINFHEEVPQRSGRAYSQADADMLLGWAKELGCNFIRTAHYPQNEYIVRTAEKMGLMVWEEIPLWQAIEFTNPEILSKAHGMLNGMINRDKNRCGIIIWSLANETTPAPERDKILVSMAQMCRRLDSTRLVSSAFDHFTQQGTRMIIADTASRHLDVIAANKYFGWYAPWPAEPGAVTWESAFNKPLIFSEFGGEALYGKHGGADSASSWAEEYQEKVYADNLAMFRKIPFLRGVCPWVLADFRSETRMNPVYQQGWNRKGLLSDKGFKKKAWYVVKNYYDSIP